MNDPKQRLEAAGKLLNHLLSLEEERREVNNRLKELEHDRRELAMNDDATDIVDMLKRAYRKTEKLEGERSGLNAKVKSYNRALRDCIFGKGAFDKDQMTFPNPDDEKGIIKAMELQENLKEGEAA